MASNCDALRYGVTTNEKLVYGHIHIYREYVESRTLTIANHFREIKRLTGYNHPAGYGPDADKHPDYERMKNAFTPTNRAEKFKYVIVDPNGYGSMGMFTFWGMDLTPYKRPEKWTSSNEKVSGIAHLNMLIDGDAEHKPEQVDTEAETLKTAIELMHSGPRQRLLTAEQQRVYDRHVKIHRSDPNKKKIVKATPLSFTSYR